MTSVESYWTALCMAYIIKFSAFTGAVETKNV